MPNLKKHRNENESIGQKPLRTLMENIKLESTVWLIVHDQVGVTLNIQDRLNFWKRINTIWWIHYADRLREEKHMIILVDAEKSYDKFNIHSWWGEDSK